jgi:EPS-associated MarR family transcriptional regulator
MRSFRSLPAGSHEERSVSSEEMRFKLLRLIEENPQLSQREAANKLGISLGKVNYCLKALMRVGWLKATRFTNSRSKSAYMYLLTPRGIEEKASITLEFLQAKLQEYEMLRSEIEQLQRDVHRQA